MNSPSRRGTNKKDCTVVFVTFESEFNRHGGLGAVMGMLPKAMHAEGYKCLLLAPYFKSITNLAELKDNKPDVHGYRRVADYSVRLSFCSSIRAKPYPVEVTEVTDSNGFRTYLLSAEGFFTAPKSPYVNPCNPTEEADPYRNPIVAERLTEDALFFCAVVPKALVELSKEGQIPSKDLILHLQDWETACVAQAFEKTNTYPAIQSVRYVLSLHNLYDRYLPGTDSVLVKNLVSHLGLSHDNVLAQMIPVMAGPLSAASRGFADELVSDPLHTHIFANHLQSLLASKRVVGIDNGLFAPQEFPFSAEAEAQAKQGKYTLILQEKQERLRELPERLEECKRRFSELIWGSIRWPKNWLENRVPVFRIMGRDDPRQKGFDVAAAAIRRIPRGKAIYIFTAMPGDEGLVGLEFLRHLAVVERPGEVMVFPLRIDTPTFVALQKGSSYLVMCSIYEPFGDAVGAYLAGMPVVARATGGLVQQVVPYRSARQTKYLSSYGRRLVSKYHSPDDAPTGFLFRERQLPLGVQVDAWRRIVECAYWDLDPKGDRIADRQRVPLYEDMVRCAAKALEDAIDLYTWQPDKYAEMIYHGYQMTNRFSWSHTIARFFNEVY